MLDPRNTRTALLIGEEGIEKLKAARVTLVGVGGVGGYAAEALVRAGVGHLTLVDGDRVEPSNINRQIIATDLTVGEYKVNAAKDRFITINRDIDLIVINKRYNTVTDAEIITGAEDFIIDAIDGVQDKVSLILSAKARGIPVVSAMGAGKRLSLPHFEIADIYKTAYDPLAKKMRGILKKEGVETLPVCYTKAAAEGGAGVGSISYVPAMAGLTIAAYVIEKLLEAAK